MVAELLELRLLRTPMFYAKGVLHFIMLNPSYDDHAHHNLWKHNLLLYSACHDALWLHKQHIFYGDHDDHHYLHQPHKLLL